MREHPPGALWNRKNQQEDQYNGSFQEKEKSLSS